MARSGSKLTKLKSVLKKLNSFNTKLTRHASGAGTGTGTGSSIAAADADDSNSNSYSYSSSTSSYSVGADLQAVYVGKSRRRYLLSPDIVDHPLFRELAERSDDDDNMMSVGCEVVLFEHLLWMIENADPLPESVDELVDFYAC